MKCSVEFRLLDPQGYILVTGDFLPDTRIYQSYLLPELIDAFEELAPGGTFKSRLGDVHWSYNVENQSIFEVYCLRIWRN